MGLKMLKKMVNGIEVELSPQEEAETRAEWLAADAIPAQVPPIISRFQAKAVLLQMELLDDVETLMTSASPIVKLAWENAIEFNRQSPSLLAMASALGLSSEQLDALFIEASNIVV